MFLLASTFFLLALSLWLFTLCLASSLFLASLLPGESPFTLLSLLVLGVLVSMVMFALGQLAVDWPSPSFLRHIYIKRWR